MDTHIMRLVNNNLQGRTSSDSGFGTCFEAGYKVIEGCQVPFTVSYRPEKRHYMVSCDIKSSEGKSEFLILAAGPLRLMKANLKQIFSKDMTLERLRMGAINAGKRDL